jgi:hypothetical protein
MECKTATSQFYRGYSPPGTRMSVPHQAWEMRPDDK